MILADLIRPGETSMHRMLFTIAAAALVAAAMPSPAQAQSHRCRDCGIEAGVAAGIAAGAATAIAVDALKNNAQAQPAPGTNYVPENDAATSGFTRRVCRVEEIGNRRIETCE
jgi:hypothetical protein